MASSMFIFPASTAATAPEIGMSTFFARAISVSTGAVNTPLNGVIRAQVAAVPEPATWGLMLLGFAGMGMLLRRRRRPHLLQLA